MFPYRSPFTHEADRAVALRARRGAVIPQVMFPNASQMSRGFPGRAFRLRLPLCVEPGQAVHRGGIEREVIDENEHARPAAGIVDEVLNEPDQPSAIQFMSRISFDPDIAAEIVILEPPPQCPFGLVGPALPY